MMRKSTLSAFLFIVAANMLPSSALAITYVANRSVGTGSVDISITTDGTLGALLLSNHITDFDITVSNGGNSHRLLFGSAAATISGTAVTATATDLLFNFDVSGFNHLLFQDGTNGPFYCLETGFCAVPQFTKRETVAPNSFTGSTPMGTSFVQRSGNFVVASVAAAPGPGPIPEPATWAMMIAGFGIIGAAMRRQRSVRVACA